MIAKNLPKYFNVTGLCVPGKHYMVDTSAKIDTIVQNYINRGEYFTINRARQFGKTTTLNLLRLTLAEDYLVIKLSFEGTPSYFESLTGFVNAISRDISDRLSDTDKALAEIWAEPSGDAEPEKYLRDKIIQTCELSPKPIVVLIDEVDRASDFQVFSAFLGILRDMYLERESENIPSFQSVILAGVHDIKNLRKKIRSDSEHSYNSPWNIAADFTVDLSFSAPEIATMLQAFEADHQTGMDITALSERLYYYTSGYPFLVSRLCKTIDETPLEWTVQGIDDAETWLLGTSNTLFDDMIKNIENSVELGRILRSILIDGVPPGFDINNPAINLGAMFGILTKRDGRCAVSNIIFETVISNYLISVSSTRQLAETYTEDRSLFFKDGLLDMDAVCTRFATFMRQEYREEDGKFIERNARLLFLAFLKPIINGTGHYAVEPQTRASRRMDVVVFYKHREYIVELKIWRGEEYEQQGIEQLTGYLKSRDASEGWLVSFCDLQEQPREGGIFQTDNCTINETIIAYRSKFIL